jgi:hypothetical protein
VKLTLWSFPLALLLGSTAYAQTSDESAAARVAASPTNLGNPEAPSAQTNPITDAAKKNGVVSCGARITQVTNQLANGNVNGVFLFTPGQSPDKNLFSVSMEVLPVAGPMAYASASFAPNQANGCAGVFDSVIYWPKRCEEIASTKFSGFKTSGKLSTNIAVIDAGLKRVFLMPADQGCVSIIKEVLLQ